MISFDDHSTIMKYITCLHNQISTKLTYDISSTSMMTMTIKKKNITCSKKIAENAKEGYLKAKKNLGHGKNSLSSERSDLFYYHCIIASHVKKKG